MHATLDQNWIAGEIRVFGMSARFQYLPIDPVPHFDSSHNKLSKIGRYLVLKVDRKALDRFGSSRVLYVYAHERFHSGYEPRARYLKVIENLQFEPWLP